MDYLKKPLTAVEVAALRDAEGFIKVVIPISLDDLMSDIEDVNDLAEGRILENGILADISYKAVGVLDDGSVLVQVTAEVDDDYWQDDD